MSIRLGGWFIDLAPLRASRDFRSLYLARVISLLGIGVLSVTASMQVYELTGSSLHVGLVALSVGLPMVIGLVVGGMLADGSDQRRMMVRVRSAFIPVAALFLVNALREQPSVAMIYFAAFTSGIVNGLSSPPLMAAMPALVGREHLVAAGALTTIATQIGAVAGPSIAGLLAAAGGYVACYLLVFLTALAVPLILARIRPLPPPPGAVRGLPALVEGWRFLAGNRLIRGLMMVDIAATIFAMPQALFPELATTRFGGGPEAIGLLYTAPAFGALIGALTSGWTGRLSRPGVVLFGAVTVWGVAIGAVGVAGSLWVAFALLAVAGAGDTISEIIRRALLQHHTPDHLQGRVSSVWLVQVIVTPALGSAQVGALARLTSATTAIVAGASLSLAATLGLAGRLGEVRRASLSTDTPASDPG